MTCNTINPTLYSLKKSKQVTMLGWAKKTLVLYYSRTNVVSLYFTRKTGDGKFISYIYDYDIQLKI